MGRIYVFMQDHPVPESVDNDKVNYIKMIRGQQAFLVLNHWTKTCTSGCRPVKEPLHKDFVEAIRFPLSMFPCKWLFTDSKLRLFNSPNSFGQYFKRAMNRLFNKRYGVTLWRHSFIN
jgi:hypothetical protein